MQLLFCLPIFIFLFLHQANCADNLEEGDLPQIYNERAEDDLDQQTSKLIKKQDPTYFKRLQRAQKSNAKICKNAIENSKVDKCCTILEQNPERYTELVVLLKQAQKSKSKTPKAVWPIRCKMCSQCPKAPPLPDLHHDKLRAQYDAFCRRARGDKRACCSAIEKAASKKRNHGGNGADAADDKVVKLLKAHLSNGHSLPTACNPIKRQLTRQLYRAKRQNRTN